MRIVAGSVVYVFIDQDAKGYITVRQLLILMSVPQIRDAPCILHNANIENYKKSRILV